MTAVKTVLFYSPVSGQITCEKHAPSRLSDTWATDRWEAWTSEHDREWAAMGEDPAGCETCRAIARRKGSA